MKEQQEIIWRQIIDFVESEETFVPWKIKQRISPEAHEIFEQYMKVMLENGMLIEFKSKGFFNKIAYWIIRKRFKEHENKDELLELFVRGPNWETCKSMSYQQISGTTSSDDEELTH